MNRLHIITKFLLLAWLLGPLSAQSAEPDSTAPKQPSALLLEESTEKLRYPLKESLTKLERKLVRDLNRAGDSLSSPYLTLANFLLTSQPHYFYPELGLLSLNTQGIAQEDALELSRRLKRVLDGRGIFIHLEELPKQADFQENGVHRYTLSRNYPDLYLERIDGNWVFPRAVLRTVQEMYGELYPFGIDRILHFVPEQWQYSKRILGLNAWNVSVLIIALLILIACHKLLTLILTFLVQILLQRLRLGKLASNVVAPVARPLSFVWILQLAREFVPAIQLLPNHTKWTLNTLNILIPVFITIILFRLTKVVRKKLAQRAEQTEGTLDDQLVPIIHNLMRVVVVIIGIVMIASNLNIDLTALIAGLSIGGLAIALAAQDMVKNLFGSLVIFLDKPFQIGQMIDIGGQTGVVESVGVRATRIRTLANSVVYVPNAQLSERVLDNLALREVRRFSTSITVQYDTPPHLLEAYIAGLRQLIEAHPLTRKDDPQVHLNNLSSSSIDIIYHMFFKVQTWPEELACRHDMLMGAIRLAHKLEVQFAFPTQTIHVENLPGQPSLSAEYTLNAETAQTEAQAAVQSETQLWRTKYTQLGDKELPKHMD